MEILLRDKGMKIWKKRDGSVLADDVVVAQSLWARMVGLIGRRSFSKGSALVIPGCRQAHTLLMRFPIDVLFIDSRNRVICAEQYLTPSKVTGYFGSAVFAVELPAGTVSACGVRVGDELIIEGIDT